MTSSRRHWNTVRGLGTLWPALAFGAVFALTVVTTRSAQAQTFTVIHNFTGGQDGANPQAGLTMDEAGNLYGTANGGGSLTCNAPNGCGTVYRLQHKGAGWIFNPLYSFIAGSDGANPLARVVFGSNGALYGTTDQGGSSCFGLGCGTVFKLQPPSTACKTALCPWTETVLYRFIGGSDGAAPGLGDLTFDQAGNIYGTTVFGGSSNNIGTVYELTPSNGGWAESVLYSFTGGSDGGNPYSGVTFYRGASLYGTTYFGGQSSNGVVFQLTPSGSSWTESVVNTFRNGSDGAYPIAGLISDPSGTLYGATISGGSGGGGTVFKLTPSGGGWTYSLVYSFTGHATCGPWGNLVLDGTGNLYGTTNCDGTNQLGSVFKLTPSGGSWTYTSLHDFTGGSDGEYPYCNVVVDTKGNLYGSTYAGGSQNVGVIWEITP